MNEQWDVVDLHRRVYELEDKQKRLNAQVQRLEQQQTEPVHVTVERGLPLGEESMLKTVMQMAGKHATDIAELKQSAIRAEQKLDATVLLAQRVEVSVNELQKTVERRFDAIAEVQKLILERLPEKE